MSKVLSKLRSLEKYHYKSWWASVRRVGEARNALLLADPRDLAEKKALLTMALAAADQDYRMYVHVCGTLDEIEQAGLNGTATS